MFLRNAWYVAAWDREVTRQPLAVRVADTPLVLYRTEDGKPVALADACWHRLAPLSMGKVIGKDGIRCPYHGIVYNSAGRCVSMPAQAGSSIWCMSGMASRSAFNGSPTHTQMNR